MQKNDVVIHKPTGQKCIVCGLFDGKCGLRMYGTALGSNLFVADINDCESLAGGWNEPEEGEESEDDNE